MKKIIISIIACFVTMTGAFLAWAYYMDFLAAFLIILSCVPAVYFTQSVDEYQKNKHHVD